MKWKVSKIMWFFVKGWEHVRHNDIFWANIYFFHFWMCQSMHLEVLNYTSLKQILCPNIYLKVPLILDYMVHSPLLNHIFIIPILFIKTIRIWVAHICMSLFVFRIKSKCLLACTSVVSYFCANRASLVNCGLISFLFVQQIVEVVCCKLTHLQLELYNHFLQSKNVGCYTHTCHCSTIYF